MDQAMKKSADVLPFKRLGTSDDGTFGGGENWLVKLEEGCLFLAEPKGTGFLVYEFLILGKSMNSVLLRQSQDGAYSIFWVNSDKFCQVWKYHQTLRIEKL